DSGVDSLLRARRLVVRTPHHCANDVVRVRQRPADRAANEPGRAGHHDSTLHTLWECSRPGRTAPVCEAIIRTVSTLEFAWGGGARRIAHMNRGGVASPEEEPSSRTTSGHRRSVKAA